MEARDLFVRQRAPMSRGRRIWRAVKWVLGVIFALYAALVIYRVYAIGEEEKTAQAVAFIHAQKVTLADVMGKNIPHIPDPVISSTTIAGVDENKNGIRDDVEIAILERHYPSARIRAAEMQYALALQMELTQVFNSETLVAAMQEEGRASGCISNATPDSGTLSKTLSLIQSSEKEVENLIFNTDLRKAKHKEIFDKYMTSVAELSSPYCDIDLSTLPN